MPPRSNRSIYSIIVEGFTSLTRSDQPKFSRNRYCRLDRDRTRLLMPRCYTLVLHRQFPATQEVPDFVGLSSPSERLAERERLDPRLQDYNSSSSAFFRLERDGWEKGATFFSATHGSRLIGAGSRFAVITGSFFKNLRSASSS